MRTTTRDGLRAALALATALACLGLAGCAASGEDGSTSADAASGAGSAAEADPAFDAEVADAFDPTGTQVGEVELTCSSEMLGASTKEVKAWAKSTLYDEDTQAAVKAELDAAKDGQTLEEPLVAYNPFGTNTQSLYVYFTTEEAASVTYTVSVSDDEVESIEDETLTSSYIADFTREVDEAATEHEFQVIGLIPNVVNTVYLMATYEDGTQEYCVLSCSMDDVLGDEELQLAVTNGDSDASLEDGLYVVLGNDDSNADFTYLYDNQGILRGEIPIINYRSLRMLFMDDLMYFNVSISRIVAMNDLGQVERVYDTGEYDLHHDFNVDADGNLLILGSDTDSGTLKDLVLRLDLETGETTCAIDFGDLLPTYKESALAYHEANAEEDYYGDGIDWLHFNTIQYVEEDDAVFLSSRETSTIMKVEDVSTDPRITAFIGCEAFWEDTDYAEYSYTQVGDFLIQGGQHTVTYVEDDELEDGQYYLYMFDNNMGLSQDTTNDFDWASVGITESTGVSDNEDATSYYYLYLVDENERTFELVDSFEVPYSGYVSSTQWLDNGNILVDSGNQGTFGEYDEEGRLIRSFSMDFEVYLYRVFKYDL